MGEGTRSLLKGCATGCGALVLVVIVALAVVTVRTCVPLQSAGRARARLEARFGPPESFTPAPDGAIPAERIETFLIVRRTLAPLCERFDSAQGKMRSVGELDEKETPSGREVADTTKGFAEVAAGIAPLVGEFFEQRNHALFDAGMGLGEYSYIFALAYREQLLDDSMREELFYQGGPISIDSLATLRSVLSHQLDESAAAAPGRPSLEREIRAMEEDRLRLPWRDELPVYVARSLAPHRVRLDESYCRATAGIELDRDSRRALAIALY
jgi:hypothetical protein